MTDLFGNPLALDSLPAPKAKKKKGQPNGYAKPPGSGPAGETCKTCLHAYYHERTKRYWKCGLVKPTSGPGTDIRLKSPACSMWIKDGRAKE